MDPTERWNGQADGTAPHGGFVPAEPFVARTPGRRRERTSAVGGQEHVDRASEAIARYDRDGCGFGRVTRERLDGLERLVERMEAKMNALLLGVSIQLLAFLFAVVLFLLYRR